MKRIISMFLVIVMAVSILPINVIAGGNIVPWNGYSKQEFAGGSGTIDDPYQITNGAQLYNLYVNSSKSDYSGACYILTQDIDLNDKMFPCINDFSGTFDGNGKTIRNLFIYVTENSAAGLFKSISGGTVKNLTLEGSVTNTMNYATGAFAGVFNGGTIHNCVNRCSVTANSSTSGTGGIVGKLINKAKIVNCENFGSITANSKAGGICGYIDGPASYDALGQYVSIYQSYNIAEIIASSHVGGIAGIMEGSTIQMCFNVGTICGTSSVGGIVGTGYSENCTSVSYSSWYGAQYSYPKCSSFIDNCYNTGKVTATSANAGGIAGHFYSCSRQTTGYHESRAASYGISCVYNVGNVNSPENVGGLVGNGKAPTEAFYLDTSCNVNNEKGTVCTDNMMTSAGCYVGFDFAEIWTFGESCGYYYPTLSFSDYQYHNAGSVATCTTDQICTLCLTVIASRTGHVEKQDVFYDTLNHWNECVNCNERINMVEHLYENSCDIQCEACEYIREIEHTYDDAFDLECNVCETDRETVGFTIISLPNKCGYEIGESLDLSGCTLRISYADGSYQDAFPIDSMTSGFDSSKGGECKITISILDYEQSFSIMINYIVGDVNGDDTVDKNDAIYLLYSVLFGDSQYPLNQTCDFNDDGSVDKNDAIYLLYHALFGETSYPLN